MVVGKGWGCFRIYKRFRGCFSLGVDFLTYFSALRGDMCFFDNTLRNLSVCSAWLGKSLAHHGTIIQSCGDPKIFRGKVTEWMS